MLWNYIHCPKGEEAFYNIIVENGIQAYCELGGVGESTNVRLNDKFSRISSTNKRCQIRHYDAVKIAKWYKDVRIRPYHRKTLLVPERSC